MVRLLGDDKVGRGRLRQRPARECKNWLEPQVSPQHSRQLRKARCRGSYESISLCPAWGMACHLDWCTQIGDTAGLCVKRREVALRVEED